MRFPHLAPALGALTLALAACGGSIDPAQATDDGYAALGRGDAAVALDHFAQALSVMDSAEPGYARARMGEVEAKALLTPKASAGSFLDWAASSPGQVAAADHHKVGLLLARVGDIDSAIDVLSKGRERFPDDAKIDAALRSMESAAAERGDERVLARLAGLGYASVR
jgi:tetratricopeptide (TPR) repeat protein